MHTGEIIDHITQWLSDYAKTSRTNGFVVGVSGGIDSAVVSTLCANTGLPVILLDMPIHQEASQMNRGRRHIKSLEERFENVQSHSFDLTSTYDGFIDNLNGLINLEPDAESTLLTYSNTRSRLRMVSLYAIAGLNGMLVCGTGNKVEDFGIGFFTKYGDGGVDLSPIADLYKSEVYRLGEALGVAQEILEAPPTDGLWSDDRSDEDQIGASYDELEQAMEIQRIHGLNPDQGVFENDRMKVVWDIYKARFLANQHKMLPIPVCEIPQELKA